ncbi:MAG: PQQ-binding-like beta-propeller repeat protein [Candidatus Hydrogenedentota bacterium]
MRKVFTRTVFFALIVLHLPAGAADWPMWRYDAARTAMSPERLPERLDLAWSRQFTPREPCWDDPLNRDLMPYDHVFEPVVMGDLMFVGFNDADKLIALDTETGETVWTHYVDGPVRMPAAARDGSVFFTADDGYLHCLDAATGERRWRFQGAPYDRRILGNRRLISTWPGRGAPVVVDDVVYFGAGIWPFMGTFLYAVDAATGGLVWRNEHDGLRYMLQPHNAPSFAGVAPHGVFVALDDRLLVPGGRSVPACFDRNTGEFQYYELAESGKTGGVFVAASEKAFFAHHREKVTSLYAMDSGEKLVAEIGHQPVLAGSRAYLSGPSVTALDLDAVADQPKKAGDARLWEVQADASGDLIGAGDLLYAGGGNTISAIRLPEDEEQPAVAWAVQVAGTVERLLAANEKLFAVTREGEILAFDNSGRTPQAITESSPDTKVDAASTRTAETLLANVNDDAGYALVYGDPGAPFLEALLNLTAFHVIAVVADAARVKSLHAHFDALGAYGHSIAVHHGTIASFSAPPYLASLTLITPGAMEKDADLPELVANVFQSLRPYGGQAFFGAHGALAAPDIQAAVEARALQGATVSQEKDRILLERAGPLPGAAAWTHHLGSIAQTGKSDDMRVKLPLGLLWFGGNSNLDVLPRHGHGPSEQVIGGRLFIQGTDCLSARDVYTGRVIWKRDLPGLNSFGIFYDETLQDTPTSTAYNQVHLPGANIRGTNFVVTEDHVYIIVDRACLVLDAATGATQDTFALPPASEHVRIDPQWGYIGVYEDILLGGADFARFSELLPDHNPEEPTWENFDYSASKRLVALNRHTGGVRWQVAAEAAFLHNGIAAGAGRVYCLDKAPPHLTGLLRRRGITAGSTQRLLALDVQTGAVIWEDTETPFGSFLNYSEAHDILLQATRPSRDQVRGERGKRMVAYRGATGEVLWEMKYPYSTFPLIHNDHIITENGMFSLATGKPLNRDHPLTAESTPWRWRREYGCNHPIACESLITFRSGAAGFYDLTNQGGTGNFGGFKSGCTANLVAADGVLNAPDYTRTCSCAYHNQTSLALIHMPTADWWTVNYIRRGKGPIERLGINFGAPGDRPSGDNILWLEYPIVGGPSPEIAIEHAPATAQRYCLHSSRVEEGSPRWVGASGMRGISDVKIALAKNRRVPRRCRVRLFFCEPDAEAVGKRSFDLRVQGETVAEALDIGTAAGGARRMHIVEVPHVRIRDVLRVSFTPRNNDNNPGAIISGIEITTDAEEDTGGFSGFANRGSK